MDNQKAFDNALFGVRAQGRLSKSSAGRCAYREASGAKCGVGHSMPDELYDLGFDDGDGVNIKSVLGMDPAIAAHFAGCDTDVLDDIQIAHDSASDLTDFESRMQALADRHNLIYTPKQQ
ncbi:hypothetical protein [Caldimonas sp. KR1-144]|uniref:hypothetical protein n=1 Tax=Caldimonas sp. KR1-144 TaxID=3400911 RepID=UPI003C05C2F6